MHSYHLPKETLARCRGPIPPVSFESDGLTCCPDYIDFFDIRAAGHFHDYAYTLGGDAVDREIADVHFFQNLRRLGLSRFKAGILYRRVRLWGHNHFNWRCDKPGILHRIWEFFSRYLMPDDPFPMV